VSLINQPFDGQLGDILIEKMQEGYNHLTIVVAFAKNSGVLRLKPEIERFKLYGGIVDIFVGVDIQGTSYEALKNLLPLCDSLYVVHSEDTSTTFHSKVFLLENDTEIWMAVGSNNLTGGGLWTNFESCHCQTYTVGTPEYDTVYTPFSNLIARYMDTDCDYSRKIDSGDDIHDLLCNGYLINEIKQRIRQNEERKKMQFVGEPLFGRPKRASLPKLSTGELTGKSVQTIRGKAVHSTHAISETNSNERIWIETRVLTGGSRNILDLSKLGRIILGTGVGSRYETDNPKYILGSVAFFDIKPEDTTVVKDITINYDAIDYAPCTIKFAPDNGSWRIQMKGESSSGVAIQSIDEVGWLMDKILVFEKIRTDYYALSVLPSGSLPSCKLASYVVARNGSSPNSKEYGLFNS